MEDKVGVFLASWKLLGQDDQEKALASFAKQPKDQGETTATPETTEACPTTVYDGIQFTAYDSKFYYYPTMHWTLDRTPEDSTYWVGIFKKDAKDTDYMTYQYVKKIAQGSYKIGQLKTTKLGEFELRIFKGNLRLKAETNKLRGVINVAPTNPFASNVSDLLADLETNLKEVDEETLAFASAIENSKSGAYEGRPSWEEQWNSFTPHQQQLLFPTLEQESLPDEITKPGPRDLDWPEPKIRFADLGEAQQEAADSPSATGPNKIVLTITLDKSYTYVYPQVYAKKVVPKPKAWMGVYRLQGDLCFDPKSYIGKDWAWVGTKHGKKPTLLDFIKEKAEGPTNTQYLGVIFDDATHTQLGFAAFTIEVAISATPAIPPPPFSPDFDKYEALRCAKLSQLAYQPYSVVQQRLPDFNLVAIMQIYNASTDTNGFIASNDTSIVVAFRGTKSFTNLLTDVKFIRKRIDSGGQSFAHSGFVKALNSVYPSIESKIEPYLGSRKLFITGHSLGGALATLAGYKISRRHDSSQPIQYVFGCPPVGDIVLANYFKGMDSNTITIEGDPVSSGQLVSLGPWVGLYKPVEVKYLPKYAHHGIADYIKQLEKINL